MSQEPLLEKVFAEFKERYLSDQQSRDKAFEDFKKQLSDEDKRLAEKYKSDLSAYPNIDDFNELKEKVTVEFAAQFGRMRSAVFILSVIAAATAIAAVLVAYYK